MARLTTVQSKPNIVLELSHEEADVLLEVLCSIETNLPPMTPRERLAEGICDLLREVDSLECKCDVDGTLRFIELDEEDE